MKEGLDPKGHWSGRCLRVRFPRGQGTPTKHMDFTLSVVCLCPSPGFRPLAELPLCALNDAAAIYSHDATYEEGSG